MTRTTWFGGLGVLLLVLGVHAGLWAAFNAPHEMPNWSGGHVAGLSFSPYREGQSPEDRVPPTDAELEQDIALAATVADRVRTYTSTEGMDRIPAIARRHGLKVTAGAWIDGRLDRNEEELDAVVRIARRSPNVDQLVIGNEVLLRGDQTLPQMLAILKDVRRRVDVPLSTAEPWHIWLKYPQLAQSVDFIALHVLPYWEGVPADQAVAYVKQRYDQVRAAYPGKPIVLAEVGWPSDGRMRQGAVPGRANQAEFVRGFLNLARAQGYDYYIMEAFDQPWKRSIEGSVGAFWGVFDADREAKFAFTGPVLEIPNWIWIAAGAVGIALPGLFWLLWRGRNLRVEGRVFYAGMLMVAGNVAAWTLYVATTQYLTLPMAIVYASLSVGLLFLLSMLLAESYEIAEALWVDKLRRHFSPFALEGSRHWPKVSLHLPICNEPPEMVMQTLDSLAKLDYPDFEVLVIDNNTKDPAVWKPVETYCQNLGVRFRFFHLEVCKGFKAGALNFGLAQTAPDAEIVGVIDSDYQVEPNWLKACVPYFDQANVGFVQAPQEHRDGHVSPFKEMINWEYAGFFNIGMVLRNERNAIIQHGTMTLIRKQAFNQLGDWATWCICEDAEMGLRLMQGGYESVYLNHAFGRGLTPDSFAGYKGQRFRWAYGAMQILRRYWRDLLPWSKSGLSREQKFHFCAGWAGWIADALSLVFAGAAVAWTAGLVFLPSYFEFPLSLFLVPTIAVFGFKIAYTISTYTARVPCTLRQTIGAALAGLALTFTVGKAVLIGLTTQSRPFLRTPKMENAPALVRGLTQAWQEGLLATALLVCAGVVVYCFQDANQQLDRQAGIWADPEALVWAAVLTVQAVPYLAAVVVSVVSAMPELGLSALRRRILRTKGT
ncbi:glycosyltransferase [Zavarzinia sp. CC-PAN008]|uniref:glycosyltransferase n=1 Tax=Zavarzinia sp. CC-PAN008 TaxID=3243332 RepID=UPI003F745EC6